MTNDVLQSSRDFDAALAAFVIRHASSDAERNNPGLCGAGRLTLDTILLTIDLDAVLRGESPVIGTTFVKTPIGLRSLELDTLLPRLIGTGQIRELNRSYGDGIEIRYTATGLIGEFSPDARQVERIGRAIRAFAGVSDAELIKLNCNRPGWMNAEMGARIPVDLALACILRPPTGEELARTLSSFQVTYHHARLPDRKMA